MRAELSVVGAGPAGLAAAIFARQRGRDVLVLDPHTPPIDKACGEGIMPPGVRALQKLGVTIDDAQPFFGVAFIDQDRVARARFLHGEGRALRRNALSARLYEQARRVGVRFALERRVTGLQQDARHAVLTLSSGERIRCEHVIAADGLHSTIRKLLGARTVQRPPQRFGVRRHFRVPPWSDLVEVHFADGAEAYVTPLGSEEIGVAILSSRTPLNFDAALAGFTMLHRRLHAAQPTSEVRGAGPMYQRVRRRQLGRTLLVGDAAGYVDAITGEGLSLAFVSAGLAIDAITAPHAHYERDAASARRRYEVFTRLMLLLSRHRGLRHLSLETLGRSPEAFARLLAASMDAAAPL